MVTRRKFLQHAGIATAAILLNPFDTMAGKAKHKIGLQLYSLNKEIRNDTIKAVLKKVSEAGYQVVETYGYSKSGKFWGLSPADFKQVLIDNNLTTTSGHYGMDDYLRPNGSDEVLKSYIEAANISGQTYITVPFLSEKIRETTDAYKAIADRLNKAGEMCKASNLKLAYHNHDFEFFPVGNSNTSGYDIFLKETDPTLVKFELDIYWAVVAKKDPLELFAQHPGRFVMLHVKDMDKANPKLNTEIGAGSIDFKSIFRAAKSAGLEQIYVEQENYSMDPFASITQSAKYVRRKLIKKI